MNKNKWISSRDEIILAVVLIGVYLFTRLINLTSLPLFVDEIGYLRVAQAELAEPYKWLMPLQVGKQPLFMWVVSGSMILVKDPILAGRLVSVFTGFLTLVGLWVLSYELFKRKRTAYVTAIIYIAYPFAVVYDRMALLDSMVGMFAVWSIYVTVRMVKHLRWDNAYSLGFLLGGATLTKSNAFFIEYLLPLSILLFRFPWRFGKIFRWAVLMVIAALVAQVLYLIVSLSPDYQIVLGNNSVLIYPIHAFIKLSFHFIIGNFFKNIILLGGWAAEYLTFPYVLLLGSSLFFLRRQTKEKVYLFLYFLIPFLVICLFGKLLYPRYIYFATLPLLLLIGDSLVNVFLWIKLKNSTLAYGAYVLAIIYPLYVVSFFIFSPASAVIPRADIDQYTNILNTPFTPSVEYFKEKARRNKILIVIDDHQRAQEGMMLSLANNPNIVIKEYNQPLDVLVPLIMSKYTDSVPIYLVIIRGQRFVMPGKYNIKIISVEKMGNGDKYMVYHVLGKRGGNN